MHLIRFISNGIGSTGTGTRIGRCLKYKEQCSSFTTSGTLVSFSSSSRCSITCSNSSSSSSSIASALDDIRNDETTTDDNTTNDDTIDDETGSLLVLSPTLWPEPDASAAGVRTVSLLNHFANDASSPFSSVHYGCGLKEKDKNHNYDHDHSHINIQNVSLHHIPPNRSNTIQTFFKQKNMNNLKVVLFDRFFSEEAFSFHFYNHKPNVLRVLDMQDMHSLRKYRQEIVMTEKNDDDDAHDAHDVHDDHSVKQQQQQKRRHPQPKKSKHVSSFTLSNELMEKVISSHPKLEEPMSTTMNKKTTTSENMNKSNISKSKSQSKSSKDPHSESHSTLLRELASIHRSDLTLVCSPYELHLLRDEYGIPSHKLALASFFIDGTDDESKEEKNFDSSSSISQSSPHSFDDRCDFVTLGGFKHLPNLDQVKVLKYDIWPKIKEQIPSANLYIYGSYPPQSILQLNDPKLGFVVKGYVNDNDLSTILNSSRVMLAPLRFGAGIKGKIIDSWRYGCPVVTTPIGSEGMLDMETDMEEEWGGFVASNTNDFVQNAVELYTNKNCWNMCQNKGSTLLNDLFSADQNFKDLDYTIKIALEQKSHRRQRDYMSAILWHQQSRSTEYFSRWIEQKETKVKEEE